MVQPRLVDFFETVERLPDVKLSGLRQEVGETPVYYENESSVGYFTRAFSSTNRSLYYLTNEDLFLGVPGYKTTNLPPHDYSASRLDTFHQFTLPETLFGWLDVTPNVGGRLTYYGDVYGPQVQTNQQLRAALSTGTDISFKASRVYHDVESSLLDVHDLRHIIEPEIGYHIFRRPRGRPIRCRNLITSRPVCGSCPSSFPSTTTLTPSAAPMCCV